MTHETSYQPAWASIESLFKNVESVALWTKEFDRIDHRYVDENEDQLVDNQMFYSYVLLEEPSGWPIRDFIPRLEAQKLMENGIKTAVEVDRRRLFTPFVEKPIDDKIMVGYDDQKEIIKKINQKYAGRSLDWHRQTRLSV